MDLVKITANEFINRLRQDLSTIKGYELDEQIIIDESVVNWLLFFTK
ncbi:hypothetical protein GCM10023163_08790 [Aestuariibaculum suncheonense]